MRNLRVLILVLAAAACQSGCNMTYSDLEAQDHVREELQRQFARYTENPRIGAIIVRPDAGKECVDRNFSECVDFYVRPLDDGDRLFHIKPEDLKFTLAPAPSSEPRSSRFQFVYRWSCCGDEAVAQGIAAFSARHRVILEGQTANGEELSFSY